MTNILEFQFEAFSMYYNPNNSKSICIPNFNKSLKEQYFNANNFYEKRETLDYYPTITICLNLTSNCNLRCKYCFNSEKKDRKLTFDEAKLFIDKIVLINPLAQKFIVDLSGSGEPLLELKTVIKIADYAMELSNNIGKEVLVSFICNGTLLLPKVVELLQSKNVLFGISLDGIKEMHDKNRVFDDGRGSFDLIINNYNKIRNKYYIGAGMTFVPEDYPKIYESYIFLSEHFETFSCRIARDTLITNESFNHICNEYGLLRDYIINEAYYKNSISFLKKMINGDDYFGRYIIKTMCNANITNRCDAGLGRFSLGSDKKVYICSSSVDVDDLCIGEYGNIDNNRIKQIYKSVDACEKCEYHHICGGECKVILSKIGKPNEYMCNLKIYLFKLSLEISGFLRLYTPNLYDELIEKVDEVLSRKFGDPSLNKLYNILKNDYEYLELKNIKDNHPKKFKVLYETYIKE